MRHAYHVHGLHIRSGIDLPTLSAVECSPLVARADVTIRLGSVPEELDEPAVATPVYSVGARDILLTVPNVGRFLAREGRLLMVEPAPDVDPGELRIFLVGSGFAAILHQRGLLPLHASAVGKNGHSFAFLGDSGAGKSTLAGMLVQRGYQLVSDDMLVLSRSATGSLLPGAGAPILKLWPGALDLAGFADTQAPFASPQYRKHLVPADQADVGSPGPLRGIVALEWLDGDAEPFRIDALTSFEAMVALRANVYREELLAPLGHEKAFLDLAASLLAKVTVLRFSRGRNGKHAGVAVDDLAARLARLTSN